MDTKNPNDLAAARINLTTELACCDSEAFPGSKGARRYSAALVALDAFDRAHPEVLAEISRAHRAAVLGNADFLGL